MQYSSLTELPCGDAFHDAPRPAMYLLDLHPFGLQVLERFSSQVVRLESQGQWLDQALTCADDPRGAPHMLQKQHPPRRLEDAHPLRHRLAVIRDGAQAQAEDHRVEPLIAKVQGLRVAFPKVDLPADLRSAPASLGQHGGAKVYCRQPDVRAVQGEVQSSTDS